MSATGFLCRLGADRRGAAIIEFALLAPAFIAMLLGVLQVGIGLQNYNAVRNVSADVARHAMVEYASGNPMNDVELRQYALDRGDGPPYLLDPDRLEATVAPAAVQRVAGAKELTITVTYRVPSLFPMMGLEGPELDYARPIFLTE